MLDTGNQGVSHSEGQGTGLLFAAEAGDRESFERILRWTIRTLGCRGDALHAWRYVPGVTPAVADLNNATDGDLLIAVALARAGRRWSVPEYTARATVIGRAIVDQLTVVVAGRTVLLPAAHGFQTGLGVVLNPSYYLFAAFEELSALAPSPVWLALRQDGMRLLTESCFGAWKLPADWVFLSADGTVRPAPNRPARFSYDAVRVPLNLAWARLAPGDVLQSCARFWTDREDRVPAWIDVQTGTTAPYPASPGMLAVRQLTLGACTGDRARQGVTPTGGIGTDYYSSALAMFAALAQAERRSVWPALGSPSI